MADAKMLLERVAEAIEHSDGAGWGFKRALGLRFKVHGLLHDLRAYLEAQAAADPQAEKDRRVGEAFRAAQALPGTYWDTVDGKWCWSPEEPRTSSSVEPEVTADTLVELVCEVRARLREQELPARWVETTLHETRTRDGVTTHTTLHESRLADTGPDTNGCGEPSCLSQVRPDVAAALTAEFGAEKAAISKPPFAEQLAALGARVKFGQLQNGYEMMVTAGNGLVQFFRMEAKAAAIRFAAENRAKPPVPEVPADVREPEGLPSDVVEDLRQAGAVAFLRTDLFPQWCFVAVDGERRYAGGWQGGIQPDWGYIVAWAKRHDSRPHFADWCERTPWSEWREEQAQEAGEAEEWQVPRDFWNALEFLRCSGQGFSGDFDLLGEKAIDLCRWVRDREEEADHAAAS